MTTPILVTGAAGDVGAVGSDMAASLLAKRRFGAKP